VTEDRRQQEPEAQFDQGRDATTSRAPTAWTVEAAGYVLRIREPDWAEHRMFKGPDTDVNLHVYSVGCPEIERMLLFRDTLRADPGERERYERIKRSLAERRWRYVQNYADAKTEVVESILARALERRR
jgi:GrpB-like predicted nucleotidyltransferase (UPF0157 family)